MQDALRNKNILENITQKVGKKLEQQGGKIFAYALRSMIECDKVLTGRHSI